MCKELVDYTNNMVMENLIRGITDEEFVKEVLNNLDIECTLAMVSGLLVSEERVRSRPPSHIRKQQQHRDSREFSRYLISRESASLVSSRMLRTLK